MTLSAHPVAHGMALLLAIVIVAMAVDIKPDWTTNRLETPRQTQAAKEFRHDRKDLKNDRRERRTERRERRKVRRDGKLLAGHTCVAPGNKTPPQLQLERLHRG